MRSKCSRKPPVVDDGDRDLPVVLFGFRLAGSHRFGDVGGGQARFVTHGVLLEF
jgi:hypothetical protein